MLTDGLQQRVRGISLITPDIREHGQEQFGTGYYIIATIPDSTDMIVLYRPPQGSKDAVDQPRHMTFCI
jgi:hypothetical protein